MKQSLIRLGYFLERAQAASLSRILDMARQARGATRRPLALIVPDMLWCSIRYDLAFRDYAMWEFATVPRRLRGTWMTHPKSHRLNVAVNSPEDRAVLSDKVAFYGRFADHLGREWLDLRGAGDEELAAFLAGRDAVIAKPLAGVGGAGVERIELRPDEDAAAFRRARDGAGQELLEELIVQHPKLAELNSGAVNTVRIISFLDPQGELKVLARVLRIGNGAAVDNFASGGMYTLLDEHGRTLHAAVDRNGACYAKHPLTGVPIEGFQVPMFDELMAMVDEAARRIPSVPYVGWDIAVGADGPCLIEGNHNSSVFQTPPSLAGSKVGLLPVYRRATGIEL